MKFSTIWSLPGMSTAERLRRTQEWAAITISALLPRSIRYWTTMGELAKATRTSENIPATSLDEVLKNLDSPR